jgi:hypothetical protein
MPPSLTAALVAALLAATWWLGRRRVPLLPSTDTSDVAALNRAQIALVQSGGASQPAYSWPSDPARQGPSPRPAALDLVDLPIHSSGAVPTIGVSTAIHPPGLRPTPAGSLVVAPGIYLARLEALYRGDGASRLQAIQAAHRWGDRRILPLLRRALRDSDPVVIRASVLAIERFRGRSADSSLQPVWRPRKVSRTR